MGVSFDSKKMIPRVVRSNYNYLNWIILANIHLPQQIEMLRSQNKLTQDSCELPHPLKNYDKVFCDPVKFEGEFWNGFAHGWGVAKDFQGNRLEILCHEGQAVKVILTWENTAINILCVNDDTLIGQATDFYPNGIMANFMFDETGKEIGHTNRIALADAFYNKDGSVRKGHESDWSIYAMKK